ncbi:glycosyltransferase [Solibacillus sp. FSL K6-1554]|uniref:glycosyltransferase n=1 Tax=Solibacillus sp. FSL K6-1554 TaxID=2921472 RepID=UPI0030F5FD77
MKKKLLFVYPELMLGGSTTSLISLLKSINYDKYEVDLILYKNRGEYFNDLPEQVNILHEASIFIDSISSKLKKISKFFFSGTFLKGFYFELVYKKEIGINSQIMSLFHSNNSNKVEKNYDVAIGYLELWADYYVLQKVNAQKKIIWIHIDYLNTRFIPLIDYKRFKNADIIVCVSESCLLNFNKVFPQLSDKSIVLENLLLPQYVENMAEKREDIDVNLMKYDGLKLITVCRLSIHTKGLDRSIIAAKKLKVEGYNFRWFIIGDGEDFELMRDMIRKSNLINEIILMGEIKNPYPYIKQCDVYVMASRREGKPMAVTEAQILGLPIIVTNYSSAKEQVINGKDGIIVDNVDDAIYSGIKEILDNPILIKKFKENLLKRELKNEELIEKFNSILE